MDWRFKKRLIYIFIFIFIILIILSPKLVQIIYHPSCYNNKQDPKEEGVDCGGPCIPCPVKELDDLIAQKPIILIYPDNTMDLIGVIKNPNKNYALKNIQYKFIIYGHNNEKFEKEGITFIGPLESKYIVETNLPSPDFIIKNYELKVFYNREDWQNIEIDPIKITLLNYDIEGNVFNGEIINETLRYYPSVNLIFIFKDTYGEVIGAFKTMIYDLKSNEKRKISYYNLPPLLGEVKEVIMYPEINIFEL